MSKLYLVDDHCIMREGLSALLTAVGHTVVGESDNPTQALADVSRLNPEVMLLDLHLGGRSGLELLAEMRRRQLPIGVVVLTMSAEPRHVAEALRMGANAYVLKGSASTELMQAISAAALGKRFVGSDIAELALQVLIRPQAEADPMSVLSPRERQIIVMVASGQSSSQIGEALHLSPKTVATYRSRLMAKLGVHDVSGLVRLAVRTRLIDDGPMTSHPADSLYP
jgi:DNA-binding NarL/FixJ family response regulator